MVNHSEPATNQITSTSTTNIQFFVLQMLEIPEDTLETVLAALMRMRIGQKAHATIQAALHLLREQQRERERERKEEVAWERLVVTE